jgi:L-methionine (R)-S-oxide reductase
VASNGRAGSSPAPGTMASFLPEDGLSKSEAYASLHTAFRALVAGENSLIANMSNLSAMLKAQFHFWWVGFYIVQDSELVLGPFQGPVACTRIAKGKGVCGTAWQKARTLIVPDVNAFPGHIACSAESKSEIVVPVWANNTIIAVLDVDSEHYAHFDDTDASGLETLLKVLTASPNHY